MDDKCIFPIFKPLLIFKVKIIVTLSHKDQTFKIVYLVILEIHLLLPEV